MAELVFHRDGEALLRVPIERDRIRLGSDPGADVMLPEADVGPGRWILEQRGGGWYALDARPEATAVHEAPLADGDELSLGGAWRATFHVDGGYLAGPPSAVGGGTRVQEVGRRRPGRLRLTWTDATGTRSLRLLDDAISLGTDPANDLVLRDGYVSAWHARLVPWDGGWRIRDMGSTNGTLVDGVPVTEAMLHPGAVMRLGQTEVAVELDEPEPLVPPHGILTRDPGMRAALDQVRRVADSDATVTVFGESGTGKELVARFLHDASTRAERAFIPVNCAAISKELIESELFGHEKGAFTGAINARRGAFEEASGGTLFLDEVGELPLDLQAKLLRALELKEIRRVGSSRPIRVDVRIVCATNRDLHAEVRAGRFREDLFYRLFVVPITLPPLRRRRDDVLHLTEFFLRTRSPRRRRPELSEEARARLVAHPWPGNVRELKNTLDRALLLHQGERIEAFDLFFAEPFALTPEDGVIHAVGKSLVEIEREAIKIALKANGGNRRLTAQSLGMARSTLQVKLKEMGIVADDAGEE